MMKDSLRSASRLEASLLVVTSALLILASVARAADDKSYVKGITNSPSNLVSTFTIPTSLSEGRDPFFPKSTYFIAVPQNPTPASGPVVLELKGVSGTPDRPLAIINNRTLAIGEEQDVNTPQGKVRVLCLEIDGTRVKVRAQGKTHELMLRRGI